MCIRDSLGDRHELGDPQFADAPGLTRLRREPAQLIDRRHPRPHLLARERLPHLLGAVRQPVSYTHLRAHETVLDLVCRLLLEKKKCNATH